MKSSTINDQINNAMCENTIHTYGKYNDWAKAIYTIHQTDGTQPLRTLSDTRNWLKSTHRLQLLRHYNLV